MTSNRIQEIHKPSAKIVSLNKRIDETLRKRSRGPAEREEWSKACAEFHRLYPELFYPGGDNSLDALKRDESAAIQTALDFLDADPVHFRSGDTKEEVWRRLRVTSLTAGDKLRLEGIALRYLERRIEREFWVMGRVMSKLGSDEFWQIPAKQNFRRYDLLDDKVKFLKGWFRDTLHVAPISELALLRLDGDLFESTMDGALYEKVSPGGFIIVDDFNDFEPCRRAVVEFREQHGITDPIEPIDWAGAFWRKSGKKSWRW
jgi:hypothetical protein